VPSILDMTVEIVKAQAAQRRMGAREIEEAIRRTAAALRAVGTDDTAAAPAGVVSAEEAARRLGVSRLTVYKYIRQGKLPATRQGRSYAVRMEDVAALRRTLRRRPRAARAVATRRRAGRTARPRVARRTRRAKAAQGRS
jgi:excisionase family DNA binding protein